MQKFSYSKVTTFRNCPKAYEFRYILGESERFSTIERHMGTAVHEALRWAYSERKRGESPDAAQIVDQFDTEWQSPGLSRSIVVKAGRNEDDYRLEGRGMIEAYARERFLGDDSETLALENRFQVRLVDGIWLTGVVDRISRSSDGMLRIIDYKTGSRVPNPLSDPQLAYYAAWAFECYPDATAELTYVDLRNGKELTAEFHRRAIVPYIETLIEEIQRIGETDEFGANPSMLCKWCGFNPICDAADPETRAASGRAATPLAPPPEGSAKQCPDCGSNLAARNGRYGNFIGCSAYPRCRYTRDDW